MDSGDSCVRLKLVILRLLYGFCTGVYGRAPQPKIPQLQKYGRQGRIYGRQRGNYGRQGGIYECQGGIYGRQGGIYGRQERVYGCRSLKTGVLPVKCYQNTLKTLKKASKNLYFPNNFEYILDSTLMIITAKTCLSFT